jgi:hypothetical protein
VSAKGVLTLIRVELVQADETAVATLADLQFVVEARTGIAGEWELHSRSIFDRSTFQDIDHHRRAPRLPGMPPGRPGEAAACWVASRRVG